MDNLHILLVCGSGASTGFMATSIRKAAKKTGRHHFGGSAERIRSGKLCRYGELYYGWTASLVFVERFDRTVQRKGIMKKKVCVLFSVLLLFLPVLSAEVISEFSFTIDANNKMLAYGEIAGVSGYYMIDTGCLTEGILFEPIQNLKKIADDSGERLIMGTIFRSPVYETEQIKLGNEIFKGSFRFLQVPKNIRNLFSEEIKGIINPCVIDGMVEISFTDRKIRLRDNIPSEYADSVRYETRQSVNFISMDVNDKAYLFLIDTGYIGRVGFPVNAVNNLPGLTLFKNWFGVSVNATSTSDYTYYYVFKQESFTLFNHTYKNAVVETSRFLDSQYYGTIGIGILGNYDIVFSPQEQKLFYRPRLPDFLYDTAFSHETYISGLVRFTLNTEGSMTIEEIVYQSPAWDKGLRPGSKITKINSISTAGISFAYVMTAIQSRQTLKIEFFDGEKNKTRTVYIYPKKLLR